MHRESFTGRKFCSFQVTFSLVESFGHGPSDHLTREIERHRQKGEQNGDEIDQIPRVFEEVAGRHGHIVFGYAEVP